MKKQIAVLMAAATAVTTVAPALAHADVTESNSSVSQMISAAKKALETKYKNPKANGITLPTNSSLSKDYLNSRYVVLVKGATAGLSESGFETLKDSAYGNLDYDMVIGKDADGNEVYINTKNTDWYVVDDAYRLEVLLEANLGKNVQMAIIDKGATKDGESVRTTTHKHYVSSIQGNLYENNQEVSLEKTAQTLIDLQNAYNAEKAPSFIDKVEVTYKNTTNNTYVKTTIVKDEKTNPLPAGEIIKIKLKLTEGKELTMQANDDAFDFSEGLKADNTALKLFTVTENNGSVQYKIEGQNSSDVMDQIVNFKYINNKNEESVEVVSTPGDTELYNLDDATVEVIELKNIYTREGGYNQEGADFVNGLIDAQKGENNYKFNFRGVNYQLFNNKTKKVENTVNLKGAKIDKAADGYKLTFDAEVRNANDKPVTRTLRFEVYGQQQRDLYDVLRDLGAKTKVVAGHFTKLAGANRYETAIAVSKEQFSPDSAQSVVIVGGKAQLDGLAAAPLASAKNAPILLADPQTGLSKATLDEIERACVSLTNKTVYIVGGEQSVPSLVKKQLEDKFGAVVLRVSGHDRNATSLEVARRLKYDGQANDRVFLVGREGAADAMSISAVAAKKDDSVKNIVVTKKAIADAKAALPALETYLADNKVEYDAAKARVKTFEDQENKLVKDIKDTEVLIKAAKINKPSDVSTLETKLESLKTQLENHKNYIAVTEKAIADAKATVTLSKLPATSTQYQDARKQLKAYQEELDKAKAALSGLEAARAQENIIAGSWNTVAEYQAKKIEADNYRRVLKLEKENYNYVGKKVSPILVVNRNGIDRTTRDFLKNELHVRLGYLIGGENNLSTDVLKDLNLVGSVNSRVAGVNRYATNVEVVKTFYTNVNNTAKIKVDGAIFASGKNEYLVDAQTSGAFAAEKNAPIILSDKTLTSDQVDLMKKEGVLHDQRAGIYQVGGVVSADVMKVVVEKLDL